MGECTYIRYFKASGELDKRISSGESPKVRPDRSKTTERTIDSNNANSTGGSWNISRISSSVRGLMCH